MSDLNDKKVAILVAEMFEQVELVEPRKALENAGATTEIVSVAEGEVHDRGYPVPGAVVVAQLVEPRVVVPVVVGSSPIDHLDG
jgi:putative intracellular protease/amidase